MFSGDQEIYTRHHLPDWSPPLNRPILSVPLSVSQPFLGPQHSSKSKDSFTSCLSSSSWLHLQHIPSSGGSLRWCVPPEMGFKGPPFSSCIIVVQTRGQFYPQLHGQTTRGFLLKASPLPPSQDPLKVSRSFPSPCSSCGGRQMLHLMPYSARERLISAGFETEH